MSDLLVLDQSAEIADQPMPLSGARWEPFSQSILGRRRFTSADMSASVAAGLAHCYAGAVLRYWELQIMAGTLDPDEPCYVLDFGGGRGRCAWPVLNALRTMLATLPYPAPRLCYVLCATDQAELDWLASHPYFAPLREDGQVDTLLWPAGLTQAPRLRGRGAPFRQPVNSPVYLLHDFCNMLERELLSVHYGKIFAGQVRLEPDADGKAAGPGAPVAYEWKQTELAALPVSWHAPLKHYLGCMNAAHLMMPGGAIELVDTLGALAGGRYMLLAHGAGVRDTQQLRFGGMRLPESCLDGAGSDSALNYHALGLHLRADATVHQQAGVRGTQVLTLALAGAGEAMLDALTPLLRGVSSAVPTALALGQGQGQSMAQLLAVLEATHDDPAVLQAIYPAAAGKLARADDAWPYAWRAALARCWRHCLPGANAAGAGRKIAVLATRIGYWGLAKEIYRQLLGWEQGGATERYQLACCEAETGNLDAAIEQMAQLRQRPGASATHQLYHDNLLRRREERRARRGACLDGIGDGELTLETLGGEHAASLHYQFRDPQISTMTGLPPLESPGDAVRWIQTHIGEDSRTSYAVMHQELGFIGVVSLQRADGCGYFFFWMGTDFQGGGYGTRAGRLLCEHHAALGIEHIFTSAYADNVRSRAALGKIGFVEIGIRAKAPFDGMRFFFRGPPGETEHTLRRKLVAFCAQSHSSFDFGSDEAAPSPGAEQA